MSTPWEDRRALFQRGKEVHEPGRRLSNTGVVDAVRRISTSSNGEGSLVDKPLTNDPASPSSPTSQRRRSSAASQSKFANLTQYKRGSEDYATRRASYTEQVAGGGLVAGWFNKTFRGVSHPVEEKQAQQKRGVME